tara:strand:- start:1648 stop:2322 length:675 start_codon:yes stop_codon:yes gene_type:complete
MDWIKKSVKKSKVLKDHYKLHDINVFIKDRLPEEINIDFALRYIAKTIPSSMLRNIDIIYIGQFPEFFDDRNVNSLYKDGAIYVSNEQDEEFDMINDIVHEVAHALEDSKKDIIYSDGRIMREFLGKRKKLYFLLKAENLNPDVSIQTQPSYDRSIDDYFYQDVGYQRMWNIINGLFLSPYAATSLREYFANGFEEYYLGDRNYLKKISPVLYSYLDELYDMEV